MSTWGGDQNTDSIGKKFIIVQKNVYSGTLTVRILSLCVTLAADLLHLLIRRREKKNVFIYLQAEHSGASIAIHEDCTETCSQPHASSAASTTECNLPSPSSEGGLEGLPKASFFPVSLAIGELAARQRGRVAG